MKPKILRGEKEIIAYKFREKFSNFTHKMGRYHPVTNWILPEIIDTPVLGK